MTDDAKRGKGMENRFTLIGYWGDQSGLTTQITIYHTLHPQFSAQMHPRPMSEQDEYHILGNVLVDLLNAGVAARPDLLAPFVTESTPEEK